MSEDQPYGTLPIRYMPGLKDIVVKPTWDAHHFCIRRRAVIADDRWAKILADPDWTDHAREDLRAERVCDRCLIDVAHGFGTAGAKFPPSPVRIETESWARSELDRRGLPH